jgi:hypothetical protein
MPADYMLADICMRELFLSFESDVVELLLLPRSKLSAASVAVDSSGWLELTASLIMPGPTF